MNKDLVILNCEQRSPEWFMARKGLGTASKTKEMIAGKTTETRAGYMYELIGQVATGEIAESFTTKEMQHGIDQEPNARSAYEFSQGVSVQEIGFIIGKNGRMGASPDGLVLEQKKGIEIKCPFNTKYHIDFLLMDKIKLEYIYQVQFSMWVTGLEMWDFCSYDPRMKKNLLKVVTIEKDEKIHDRFDSEIGAFILDMDSALAKLEITFGE